MGEISILICEYLNMDWINSLVKVLHIPRNFKISCYMAVLWDLAGFDCLSGIVKNKHLGTDSCHLRPEIPSSDPSAQVLHRSSWSGVPPWSPAASTNLGISAEKRLCAGLIYWISLLPAAGTLGVPVLCTVSGGGGHLYST